MNTDGSAQEQLTSFNDVRQVRLSNNVLLFYRAGTGSLYWKLYGSADATAQIVPNSPGALEFDLDSSGSKIVLTYGNNFTLWTLNVDGSSLTKINDTPNRHNIYPYWGPDGYIYFGQSNFGDAFSQAQYRIPVAGVNNPVLLVPAFSQYVAVTVGGASGKGAYLYNQPSPQIALMDADGQNAAPLASSPSGIRGRIVWDPDLDILYFVVNGGVSKIATDGSAPVQIATNAEDGSVDVGSAGGPPTITKAFTVSTNPADGTVSAIPLLGTAFVTLTVSNPNAVALTGVSVTDVLPTGLRLSSPNVVGGSCATLGPGTAADTIALVSNSIPAFSSCILSVQVTGVQTGSWDNTTGAVTSTGPDALTGATSNTATLTVVAPPAVTKQFSPALIALGGTSTMTITVTNPNTVNLNNVTMHDTFPMGLIVATPSGLVTTCPGVTANQGEAKIDLNPGMLPLLPGTCTITVNVTATVHGTLSNQIQAFSPFGLSNIASATLTVADTAEVLKQFTPTLIPVGGVSTMTITLNNPNHYDLPGVKFTDVFPVDMLVASPNGLLTNCPGAVTATAGTGTVTLDPITLPFLAPTCTITVNVTSTVPRGYANSVQATTLGVPGNTAMAALNVEPPLAVTIGMDFQPASIPLHGTSVLRIVLTNPNLVNLTGVRFHDSLPTDLVVATPDGLVTDCAGSVTTFPSDVIIAPFTLPPGTCTVRVNVTSGFARQYLNVVVADSSAGQSNTASDWLEVLPANPATITKAFSPTSIVPGGTSTMTITVTNSNAFNLADVRLDDSFPTGLFLSTSVVSNTCPGVVNVAGSLNGLTLDSLMMPMPPGSCAIMATVTSAVPGPYLNVAMVRSAEGHNEASATLTVQALLPPTFTKAFLPTSIPVGGTSTMTLSVTNPNLVAIPYAALNDHFPTNLTLATPSGLLNTCAGSVTALAGDDDVTMDPGPPLPVGTCGITVNVTSAVAGVYLNTAHMDYSGGFVGEQSATLTVVSPPSISKQFTPTTIAPGGVSTLAITITNPNSVALTNVAFTDAFPTGLFVATPNGLVNGCPGSVTATAGSATVSLQPTTFLPGGCTITVNVTSTVVGDYDNTLRASSLGGPSNTASARLTVQPRNPVISKSFSPTQIAVGATTTLTITVHNPGIAAMTAVAFTDNMPSSLLITTPSGLTVAGCGGGTVTAGAGTSSVSLSGGTVQPGVDCVITVTVQGTAPGAQNNIITSVTGTVSANVLTGDPASAMLTVGPSEMSFLVRYAANLTAGDAVVNLTNVGAFSSLPGVPSPQNGNLCANVYTYSPDEQLVSCCSCVVTPNALNSLSVNADLTSNTLTPIRPSAVVMKILGSAPNVSGSCNPATVTRDGAANYLAPGLAAWGSSLHALPGSAASFGVAETPFVQATLSGAELTRMTQLCAFIQANGSGYGICKSCKVGGLGAAVK